MTTYELPEPGDIYLARENGTAVTVAISSVFQVWVHDENDRVIIMPATTFRECFTRATEKAA